MFISYLLNDVLWRINLNVKNSGYNIGTGSSSEVRLLLIKKERVPIKRAIDVDAGRLCFLLPIV